MLEPALTLDANMNVVETLQYLDEYPGFRQVVVRAVTDGAVSWFAFEVAELRWLLQDVGENETLGETMELGSCEATPTFEGPLDQMPANFQGVILDGYDALAVSYQVEEAAIGEHRGAGPITPGRDTASGGPRAGVQPGSVELADAAAVSESMKARNAPDTVTLIPVFYATDRSATGKAGPVNLFGSGRSSLQFGAIQVSIPPGHTRGEVEVPKWWKLQFSSNPDKHITLQSAESYDQNGFVAAMRERFEQTSENEALVFVHGYKVGFDAGIRRTAQIAHDLRFRGAPILYSWPSSDALLRYTHDENEARWSEPHFTEFLELLLNQSGATSVHVIAHSMGNRIVSESLHSLPDSADTSRLGQVIFAAPDIDADTFEAMAERFEHKASQMTLYASSGDLALRASKLVHGYQRAGDSEPALVVTKPIVTVDASQVDTNLMGHSYIGDSTSILADIHHLLRSGSPPEQRSFFLEPAQQNGQRYWLFKT